MWVYNAEVQIPLDPNTGVLELESEWISPIIEDTDPSGCLGTVSVGIYDPDGSGIQLLWIRFRDPFSGSTTITMSDWSYLS